MKGIEGYRPLLIGSASVDSEMYLCPARSHDEVELVKTAEWLADGKCQSTSQAHDQNPPCFLDTAFLIMTLVPFRCSKCERIESREFSEHLVQT